MTFYNYSIIVFIILTCRTGDIVDRHSYREEEDNCNGKSRRHKHCCHLETICSHWRQRSWQTNKYPESMKWRSPRHVGLPPNIAISHI